MPRKLSPEDKALAKGATSTVRKGKVVFLTVNRFFVPNSKLKKVM